VQLVQSTGAHVAAFIQSAAVFFAKARTLETEAAAHEREASALRVVDKTSDERAVGLIHRSRDHKKIVDAHWTIRPLLSRLHKMTVTASDRALIADENAIRIATRSHTAFEDLERRRVEEEQRRLDEEARQAEERRRAAELARLEQDALEAEAAAPDLSKREALFVEEMVAHGDQVRAARVSGYKNPSVDAARLLKLAKINRAIEAQETAKAIRQQAAAKAAEPVYYDPPPEPERTTAKATTKYTLSAEITDETALVQRVLLGLVTAVLLETGRQADPLRAGQILVNVFKRSLFIGDGPAPPLDMLRIDQKKASEHARALGEIINRWPGCRLKKTPTVL
jgi:hypothetical protein